MVFELRIIGVIDELLEFLLDDFTAFRMLLYPLLKRLLESAGPFKTDHPSDAPEEIADGTGLDPSMSTLFQVRPVMGADFFPLPFDDPLAHDLVDHFLVFQAQA